MENISHKGAKTIHEFKIMGNPDVYDNKVLIRAFIYMNSWIFNIRKDF